MFTYKKRQFLELETVVKFSAVRTAEPDEGGAVRTKKFWLHLAENTECGVEVRLVPQDQENQ